MPKSFGSDLMPDKNRSSHKEKRSRSSPPSASYSSCRIVHGTGSGEKQASSRQSRSSSPNSGSGHRRRKHRSGSSNSKTIDFGNLRLHRRRSSQSQEDLSSDPQMTIDPAVREGLMRSGGSSHSGGSRRSKSARSMRSIRSKSTRSRSSGGVSSTMTLQRPESASSNKVPSDRISDLSEQTKSENNQLLPRTTGWVKSPYGGRVWMDGDCSTHRVPFHLSKAGFKRNWAQGGGFWMERAEPKDRRCSNPELSAKLNQLSEDATDKYSDANEYQGTSKTLQSTYGFHVTKENTLGVTKKNADPTLPGPGFSRTHYGGFYSRYRCVY